MEPTLPITKLDFTDVEQTEVGASSRLLLAVAAASAVIARVDAVDGDWDRALGILGEAAGFARVYILENSGPIEQEVALCPYQWAAPGFIDFRTVSGVYPVPFALFAPWIVEDLRNGRPVEFDVVQDGTGRVDNLERLGVIPQEKPARVLSVPLQVFGQWWGSLAFDCLADSPRFSDTDRAALQSLGATIGAVLERKHAEQARLEEERARAEATERLNRLLQSIVAGSRTLLDAADFEPALNDWLKMMCEAQGAISATYYDTFWHEGAGETTLRVLAEWAPRDTPGRRIISFANPHVHDPRGFEEHFRFLRNGISSAIQAGDVSGHARTDLDAQGHATTIVAPIMDGERWIGAVSFDYWQRRELNPQDEIILKTAADSLASILQRNDLQAKLVAEQAARAELAEAAAADLGRRSELLEAVVAASDAFLRAESLAEAADAVVERIGRAMGVDRSIIGRNGPPDQGGVLWYTLLHEWVSPGTPRQIDDPRYNRIDLTNYTEFLQYLRKGQPVALVTEDLIDPVARADQAAIGTQSQYVYPIMVDGDLWGVINVDDCTRPRRFDMSEIATLKLVASALGSLIKRERLVEARLEAERHRAAAVERSARLLASVAKASEELLRAGSYRDGIDEALRALGESVDSGRVYVIENEFPAGSGEGFGHCLHQWASADLINTARDPKYYPFPLDQIPPQGRERLRSGEAYVYFTSEHTGAQRLADFSPAVLPHTAIGVPILIGTSWWGTIWFDLHGDKARVSLDDEPALRAAASAIASALERDLAVLARLDAERELAEEKSRMAREIHDTLAQGFTGVIMQLHAAEDALDAADVADASLRTARALDRARLGLSEARRSVYALRPPMLDDGDLEGAMRMMLDRVFDGIKARPKLSVLGKSGPLSEPVLVEVFRVGQEAVGNAVRHANADSILVRLDWSNPDFITLSVEDDGIGFDVDAPGPRPGFGLVSMRERASRLGGRLEIEGAVGLGVCVRLTARRNAGAISSSIGPSS